MIASKTKFALDSGVNVIWCCGELPEQRERDNTMVVIERQLSALAAKLAADDWLKMVIAYYEPIGATKVASVKQAQGVHAAIRKWLGANVSKAVADATRIIHGGSVNSENCKDLAEGQDIDGFLIGAASLKPECMCPPPPLPTFGPDRVEANLN